MSYKKLVYVAGPNGGVRGNLDRHIESVARFITSNKDTPYSFVSGMIMYNHLYTALPYDEWIELCFGLLDKCDYLLLLPGWKDSKGCYCEWAYAKRGKDIRVLDMESPNFCEDLVSKAVLLCIPNLPEEIIELKQTSS